MSAIEQRCVAIADAVVPNYRNGKRAYGCTSQVARMWQAAYDGAAAVLATPPASIKTDAPDAQAREVLASIFDEEDMWATAQAVREGKPLRFNSIDIPLRAIAAALGRPLAIASPEIVAGFVMVPVKPTREMWAAGADAVVGYKQRHHDKVVEQVWSNMLAAAPKAAEAEA